ncbi:hypothetical protein CA984_08360 [Streptosporangium minutum]|uniref:Uncharacterized protein n=1 Tax=Streptosporangium minutum TaxID=569862 RepID=A0A243RSM3_9ACTN|nr:hypothetical protein CA984_08360 [Streptosporangium minutum]
MTWERPFRSRASFRSSPVSISPTSVPKITSPVRAWTSMLARNTGEPVSRVTVNGDMVRIRPAHRAEGRSGGLGERVRMATAPRAAMTSATTASRPVIAQAPREMRLSKRYRRRLNREPSLPSPRVTERNGK